MQQIQVFHINESAAKDAKRFVDEAETRYTEFTSDIAERIAKDEKIKIVLLAGPSGSGKTTTANLLADEIRKRGLSSAVISLDDFYRSPSDPDYPTLPNGERDYEAVEALNLTDIVETLISVADEKDFTVPKYDFKLGRRTEVRNYPKISHGCVIIEGLHALNPKIFEHLPKEKVLRVFISVSTNVYNGFERILSGRKMRFIRRMVRDSIYRGADAERTLEMWGNVLFGEDKYLYPFRKYADIDFNTFHSFELCVMKKYVEKLITPALACKDDYAEEVLSAIEKIVPIDEELVPQSSLIREFINEGKYEEFY